MGQFERHAKISAQTHDIGLGKLNERRANRDAGPSFDAGFRGQITHVLEGLNELGPAIGIAGIIESVDADEDVVGLEHFGPGEGEGEEDSIARRHVGHGDFAIHGRLVATFGNRDLVRQCRVAEDAQIDLRDTVIQRAERRGNAPRRLQFDAMPLAVVE